MRSKIAFLKTYQIAWLMAIVYVWLSGAVELTHTDDLRAYAPIASTAGQSQSVQHTTPQPKADNCIAHEWSGTVHSASSHSVTALPSSILLSTVLPALKSTPLAWRFDGRYLRGPPTSSI